MFSRVPGFVRVRDEDGEEDPAIEPVPAQVLLSTENGLILTTEDGNPLTITPQ